MEESNTGACVGYAPNCRRWTRLAQVSMAFLLFWSLHPLALADLFVSDNGNSEVRRFSALTGVPINPIPFIANPDGGEGIACLTVGGATRIFVANNGDTINTFDVPANPIQPTKLSVLVSIGGGAAIGALSLSLDGTLLYAADWGNNKIYAFKTIDGTLVHSTSTLASHDVRVGPDGNVYATDFQNSTGVLKFNPDLTPFAQSTFVANSNNGLGAAGAMTFDAAGNLWVADFSATSTVYEYDSAGNFLRKITDPLLNAPFGLDVGPDGTFTSPSSLEISSPRLTWQTIIR